MLDISECTWPWLGGNAGRVKSDGRTEESGGGTAGSRQHVQSFSRSAKGYGQRRDVRFFDLEYFVFTVNTDERGSVPEPVRQRGPHGDRGACDPGDGGEHAGGGYIL